MKMFHGMPFPYDEKQDEPSHFIGKVPQRSPGPT